MSHQQADKHGPSSDDRLKNPRRQTSAGTRHAGRAEDYPLAETTDDGIRLRSELARFLGPASFPGTAGDLLAHARDNDATEEVQRLLQSAPDRIYRTVEEVFEAVRGPIDR